jgi:hypothetical protein
MASGGPQSGASVTETEKTITSILYGRCGCDCGAGDLFSKDGRCNSAISRTVRRVAKSSGLTSKTPRPRLGDMYSERVDPATLPPQWTLGGFPETTQREPARSGQGESISRQVSAEPRGSGISASGRVQLVVDTLTDTARRNSPPMCSLSTPRRSRTRRSPLPDGVCRVVDGHQFQGVEGTGCGL